MAEVLGLTLQFRHEAGVAVAEGRRPPGCVGVDVAATVGIDEARAVRFDDDDRVDVGTVPTHFSVWMPHSSLVEDDDSIAQHVRQDR
jgi:hypothetical protein